MKLLHLFLFFVSVFASVRGVLYSSQKTYVCDNKKKVITCEHKKNSTIKVLDAYYGRHLSYKCLKSEYDYGKFKNSTCKATYTKVFQKRCDGEKKCELDTKSLKAQCKNFVPKMLDVVFECESSHKQLSSPKTEPKKNLKTLKRKRKSKIRKHKLTRKQILKLKQRKAKLLSLRHKRKQLLKKRGHLSGKKIKKHRLTRIPNLSLNHKVLMDSKLIRHHLHANSKPKKRQLTSLANNKTLTSQKYHFNNLQ